MFKVLVDTCVWLDLAKDPKQRPVLGVVEELVRRNSMADAILIETYAERLKERVGGVRCAFVTHWLVRWKSRW